MAKFPEIVHKRGDTFALGCTYKDAAGLPTTLEDHVIESQLRDREDSLVQSLTCELSDQEANPGFFSISATAAQTALWPAGRYLMDIQITLGVTRVSSETVSIRIEPDITHD
jgi:hypothetical protein